MIVTIVYSIIGSIGLGINTAVISQIRDVRNKEYKRIFLWKAFIYTAIPTVLGLSLYKDIQKYKEQEEVFQ